MSLRILMETKYFRIIFVNTLKALISLVIFSIFSFLSFKIGERELIFNIIPTIAGVYFFVSISQLMNAYWKHHFRKRLLREYKTFSLQDWIQHNNFKDLF